MQSYPHYNKTDLGKCHKEFTRAHFGAQKHPKYHP